MHLMDLSDTVFRRLLSSGDFPIINIGTGLDMSGREIAELILPRRWLPGKSHLRHQSTPGYPSHTLRSRPHFCPRLACEDKYRTGDPTSCFSRRTAAHSKR